MRNEKLTISAHEINKFTYCPHQWYYERMHGAKALRALHKARNERLGLEDATAANLARGLRFHSGFGVRGWGRVALRLLAVAAVVAAVLWFCLSRGWL